MYKIDTNKIRGLMAERGITIAEMAKKTHIHRNTYAEYLKVPDNMPYRIIKDTAKILNISGTEAGTIFFADELAETQENKSGT